MSHEIQIRSGESMPGVAEELQNRAHVEQIDSAFVRVHRLLRGRYIWALVLGIILGVIGGFAGYKSAEPLWTCSGMVQVKMDRDVVLSNSPENQNTQSPEAIKETQIALMRSQRIINAAMISADWTALKRPLTDDSISDFMKKLVINSQGRSEIINVTFTDPDSAAASAAVKGLLTAYNAVYIEAENTAEKMKREKLEYRRKELVSIRDMARNEIENIANISVGADDLRAVHQSNVAM